MLTENTRDKRTIFLACFHLLASRNILATDVFKTISSDKDTRVVIFTPDYKKDFYEEIYGGGNVLVEGINESLYSRKFWFKIFRYLTPFLVSTYTNKLRALEQLHKNKSLAGYLNYFVGRFITLLFAKANPIKNCVRYFDQLLFSSAPIEHYFEIYKPSCVFVTDVFSPLDIFFIQTAKKNHILSIGMIRSWDNPTTRGLMRALPDKLIANNEIIKNKAVQFHNATAENIFVGGIPQYDFALRKSISLSRKEFFGKIGADSENKLIIFAPAGKVLSDTDWQICDILKRAQEEKKIPANIRFLVRSHPADPADLSKFQPNRNFIIERPGTYFKKEGDSGFKAYRNFFGREVPEGLKFRATEFTFQDVEHLINCLYYSEMVIHISSTIGIDALLFDKPQIMIEFDGWEKKPYLESVRRYHDEDHMAIFLKTGAARIAHSSDELISLINNYLQNSLLDQENRKKALREQVYYLDGRSGERIGRFILGNLIF